MCSDAHGFFYRNWNWMVDWMIRKIKYFYSGFLTWIALLHFTIFFIDLAHLFYTCIWVSYLGYPIWIHRPWGLVQILVWFKHCSAITFISFCCQHVFRYISGFASVFSSKKITWSQSSHLNFIGLRVWHKLFSSSEILFSMYSGICSCCQHVLYFICQWQQSLHI